MRMNTSHYDGARMRHVVLRGESGARGVEGTKARQLTICQDTEFALCAASTCVATGGIVKNNQGKKYPAVTCECPIIVGNNVADLNGGNMKGSCTSSDPNLVYSTFEFSDSFPQLINGTWQDAPSVMQVCPSQDSFSQCGTGRARATVLRMVSRWRHAPVRWSKPVIRS